MNNEKIQEMQIMEQRLNNMILQKQSFQMELSEAEGALSEIENSDDVFKIIGNIMIKSDKNSVKKELSEKREVLSMRIKAIEKQEDVVSEKVEALRDDLMKSMKD